MTSSLFRNGNKKRTKRIEGRNPTFHGHTNRNWNFERGKKALRLYSEVEAPAHIDNALGHFCSAINVLLLGYLPKIKK